ncbi:MAG: YtxH domain-containing protein [Actinomycetota bacterium]
MGAFKRGAFIGFAAGYVFGARAGRERYEQIRHVWARFKRSPAMMRASGKAGAAIGLGIERSRLVALGGIDRIRGRVRRAAGNGL